MVEVKFMGKKRISKIKNKSKRKEQVVLRKRQKGSVVGKSINHSIIHKQSNLSLKNNKISLYALETGYLTQSELDSLKKTVKKRLKKLKNFQMEAIPFIPRTKKPSEVRMGKGKGNKVDIWVCPVKAGKRLLTITSSHFFLIKKVLLEASYKISMKLRVERKK